MATIKRIKKAIEIEKGQIILIELIIKKDAYGELTNAELK